MRKLKHFEIKKAKRPLKYISLLLITCYSIAVVFSILFYYKKGAEEIKLFPKISFGIDIVGGNQLTVAIDSTGVMKGFKTNLLDTINLICKENKVVCDVKNTNNQVDILIRNTSKNTTKKLLMELRQGVGGASVDVISKNDDKLSVIVKITEKVYEKTIADTTDKAIAILKNRIDGVGVKEIAIQRYGTDKIVILIPQGVDVNRIKKIINTTAKLTFNLMDSHHIFRQKPKEYLKDHTIYSSYDNQHGNMYFLVETKPALTGDVITNANVINNGFSVAIGFKMNTAGGKKFAEITRNNIGRLLAIVLDEKVLMAPRIQVQISDGNGSITGNFSVQEANDLAILLRSGSLPAKIEIINDRHLSSIFDRNILSYAGYSVFIAMILTTCLMCLRYKKLGFVSIIALLLNFFYTITTIAVCGFTLTLPGIAGFVLMLGMATDANILIYEKMKELKKQGINQVQHIIKNGFSKALATIIDSNLTTIIAGVALFGFGGSFIKGFSITLILGIIFSIFTAVNITKMIIEEIYKNKNKISI